MPKEKNSLGFLVLPVLKTDCTFDEYKTRYGIDLNYIFYLDNDLESAIRPNFSKVILMCSKDPKRGILPPTLMGDYLGDGTIQIIERFQIEDGAIVPVAGFVIDVASQEVSSL